MNGVSQGISSKTADRFHAFWRVKFASGTIKAVSRKDGKTVLEKEIHTAGKPSKIELTADRTALSADGKDLAFITVKVTDEAGNMVPDAANLINFNVTGSGCIVGVDNGCQTSMEPFKASYRKAFNGMCLLIVQTDKTSGEIKVKATSESLQSDEILLKTIKRKNNL
jgi:beta-galactosidase